MKQNLIIGVLILAIILIFGYILQDVMGNPIGTKPETETQTTQTMEPQEKVKIEDITEGTGEPVKSGDTVVINYRGMLEDGTQFDSSYDRGQPFTTQIGVGRVIQGWDQGIPGLKVGGKRKLTIPSSLGYGETGAPPSIPPNATLIFEVELVGIE